MLRATLSAVEGSLRRVDARLRRGNRASPGTSFETSAGWTFGNRKVSTPRAQSAESSCFRRAPPSSTNERSDKALRPVFYLTRRIDWYSLKLALEPAEYP